MQDNAERIRESTIEAERTVLGAILSEGMNVLGECVGLRGEHFMLPSHQAVYNTCVELAGKGDFDQRDVMRVLGKDLEKLGGLAWFAGLTIGIPRRFNPANYVAQVIEVWRGRRGAEVCQAAIASFEAGERAVDVLAALQSQVLDAIEATGERDEPLVAAYSDAAYEDLMERSNLGKSAGLSFGMKILDDFTSGMLPHQVTVVGARSGVGKTSLMKQTIVANASANIAVCVFSLEETRQRMLEGLWCIVSGVEARKMSRPHLMSVMDRENVRKAAETVKAWPLRIYEKSDMHIDQIVAFGRLNARQFGAKLICVDYAQNVEAEGRDERTKVTAVSRKLTKMVKDEGCHLMLLSQLRKVPHEQYNKVPTAADLRETGQLENDAHVILLLHRGWDEEGCKVANEASIIVPKIRGSQTGAVAARFNVANLTFEGV